MKEGILMPVGETGSQVPGGMITQDLLCISVGYLRRQLRTTYIEVSD